VPKKFNSKKFKELYYQVLAFNQKRGWNPVDSDLAKSICIESAELLEKFQWDASDKREIRNHDKDWHEISLELADIVWYIISFCNETGIDLSKALEDKLAHNEKKYPESKFKGTHNDKFYKKQKRKYRQNKN